MGELLPQRQLRAEVRCGRRLRARTDRHPGQPQVRVTRAELETPVQHHVVPLPQPPPLPTQRHHPLPIGACLTVNDVGEPCTGEPHARFDGGPLAKRKCTPSALSADQPAAYPTAAPLLDNHAVTAERGIPACETRLK